MLKNYSWKSIAGFALGMALGSVIYDYFFHESVDWGKAVFQGIFITVILFVFKQASTPRTS